MVQFVHHDLRLLNPRFDAALLDVLTDLEHLRRLQIRGTTPPLVFLQLKEVFQCWRRPKTEPLMRAVPI